MHRSEYADYRGQREFYNEDGEMAIRPTPVVGMVGVIDDVEDCVAWDSAKKGT